MRAFDDDDIFDNIGQFLNHFPNRYYNNYWYYIIAYYLVLRELCTRLSEINKQLRDIILKTLLNISLIILYCSRLLLYCIMFYGVLSRPTIWSIQFRRVSVSRTDIPVKTTTARAENIGTSSRIKRINHNDTTLRKCETCLTGRRKILDIEKKKNVYLLHILFML